MNPKILHILPDLRKGGAERLVMDICLTMQLNNISEVRLITFKPHNDYLFASKGLSIEVVPSYVVPSLSGKWRIHIKELQGFIFDFLGKPYFVHSLCKRHSLFLRKLVFDHCNKAYLHE